MTNLPPDPSDDTSTPRWVKVSGVIVIILVLLFGIMILTGGNHGPGRHLSGAQAPGHQTHKDDLHVDHDAMAADVRVPAGLQVSTSGYTLSPISAPEAVAEAGTLSFRVLGPSGKPVTEFTKNHEKDLHLIVVRTDTAEFYHVHPVVDANGHWSIDWAWETAGTYKVLADFVPTELGEELALARLVEVAGHHTPQPLPDHAMISEVDGYTVTLTGDLVAGASSLVTATVERDGQPVLDLEPYLGAYGHLVALRDGDLAYIHVHPDGKPGDGATESGPEVSFHIETPTVGIYRLFLDFQVDGEVRTADFTLSATEPDGTPSDAPADHEDEHGDGHTGGRTPHGDGH